VGKLIDAKQRLKKGLMQQLLSGRMRFQEFGKPIEKKGGLPEGWREVRLGKYAKLQGGFAFKSNEFKEKGIPIIRISNINNLRIQLDDDVVFYDEINIGKEFIVKNGDCLIAMSGATTGKIGRYKSSHKAYLNQRVGKFVVTDPNQIAYDFLAQVIITDNFKNSIFKNLASGAQPNISGKQIENIKITLPIVSEQTRIAAVLSACDREIELLKKKQEKLKEQKKGLMQKLLTGEVRVKLN